jgi:hypothetical protein
LFQYVYVRVEVVLLHQVNRLWRSSRLGSLWWYLGVSKTKNQETRKLHNQTIHYLCAPQDFTAIHNQRGEDEWAKLQLWERREMHTVIWLGNVNVRNHLENLGVVGRLRLNWVSQK